MHRCRQMRRSYAWITFDSRHPIISSLCIFFSGRSYSTVITREFWKKIHATIRSTEPVKKEKSYQNNIIIAPEPNVEGRIRCYRHPTKVETEMIRISVNTLLLYLEFNLPKTKEKEEIVPFVKVVDRIKLALHSLASR